MSPKKIILITLLFLFSLSIFVILEYGVKLSSFSEIIQPTIFALSLVVNSFSPSYRKFFIVAALVCFCLMLLTYFLNLLDASNWMGSLGFGVLFITVLSYLPQLIKKGFIEKY